MKKDHSPKKSYRPVRLLLLLAFLLACLRFMMPWILFKPAAQLTSTPADAGLSFEDAALTAADGTRLHGWYIPAPDARAALLFFHGNAGNISHRISSIEIFHKLRLSVFILDYRGYGQSGGKVSVEGTALDAEAAWLWLTEEKKVPPEKIVVFGRSLGGAVAMRLMRSVTPGALILESTFSSPHDRFPFLSPVTRLVFGNFWNSSEAAVHLTVPTLCIHSPDDWLVPYRVGRRLYDAVASEKTFVEIHGGHNDGFLDSYDIYVPALDEFLTKHFGAAKKSRPTHRRYFNAGVI